MSVNDGGGSELSMPHRWSRRKTLGIVAFAITCVVVMMLGGLYSALLNKAESTLTEAIADADRLDPGWRLEDIKAAREKDVIPGAEDAGALVINVGDLLPKDWLKPTPKPGEPAPPIPPFDLDAGIYGYHSNMLLGCDLYAALHEKMAEFASAIALARPLSSMKRGKFPLEFNTIFIRTRLPHLQKAREVVQLLRLSAWYRAEKGDLDGAIENCLEMFGVANAVGDEPFAVSQMVRINVGLIAIQTLERILSQGTASDEALRILQERLARESRFPFALTALRGERAGLFDMQGKMADGIIPSTAVDNRNFKLPSAMDPLGRVQYRYNQGFSLRLLTGAVEAARLPIGEQWRAFQEWDVGMKPPKNKWQKAATAATYALIPPMQLAHLAHVRAVAMFNVGQVMVAMERFRIVNGRWPKSLSEIPSSILPEIPIDPFSGKSILVKKDEFIAIVYSVGHDGIDNEGAVDQMFRLDAGLDWGYTLTDTSIRRISPYYDEELPSQPFLGEPLLDDSTVLPPEMMMEPTP